MVVRARAASWRRVATAGTAAAALLGVIGRPVAALSLGLAIEPAAEVEAHAENAVVAMLTDDMQPSGLIFKKENYLDGALALGASLQRHLHKPVDKLLLVRDQVVISNDWVSQLQAVGWRMGTVPTVKPLHSPSFKRFSNQFAKFALFNMTKYKKVFYMDLDTLAVGPLDDIFDTRFKENQFLANIRDWHRKGFSKTDFNMGVALVRPNATEYKRMVALLRSDALNYSAGQAEQGFLNALYPFGSPLHVELPYEYGGLSVCEVKDPKFWQLHRPFLRVIHYTEKKPWQCPATGPAPYCGEVHLWREELGRAKDMVAKAKAGRLGMVHHQLWR